MKPIKALEQIVENDKRIFVDCSVRELEIRCLDRRQATADRRQPTAYSLPAYSLQPDEFITMPLKPHDLMTVLKLVSIGATQWSYRDLSEAVGLSVGGLHKSLHRLKEAALVYDRDGDIKVASRKLLYFVIHGAATVFYPQRGQISRGMPTALSAPIVRACGKFSSDAEAVIWPTTNGEVRGESLLPLYPSAPQAAAADEKLYELLSLFDVIRIGKGKDRKVAADLIEKKILGAGSREEE